MEEQKTESCETAASFPSAQTTFIGSLSTWLLLEAFMLGKTAPFKKWKHYKTYRNAFLAFSVIVGLSRYYLNYQTIDEVISGFLIGTMIAMAYFFFLFISVFSGDREAYRKSLVAKVWKKLNLSDNYTNFKQQEQRLAMQQLKELEKKAEMITKLKSELKSQRDELTRRVNILQSQRCQNNFQ